MNKRVKDYGMLVTVTSSKDSYLFVDSIDMDRYVSTLIKMIAYDRINMDAYSKEFIPLIAGMQSETAKILFSGGDEEVLRRVMRSVHISYSAYRKNKKMPVKFGKSTYELIEGIAKLKETQKMIKENCAFVCSIKF